jgi:hypothetical protein
VNVWGRIIGTYDGELDVSWANFRANFVDILDPVLMRIEVVGRETNDFDISSSKVRSTTSDLSELGRANLGPGLESGMSETFAGGH